MAKKYKCKGCGSEDVLRSKTCAVLFCATCFAGLNKSLELSTAKAYAKHHAEQDKKDHGK